MSKTKIMTQTVARTALAALLLCSAAAQAATFSLSGSTDDIGPLPGAAFTGLFSYDDGSLPVNGEVDLNSFSLNFAGQIYTLASATAGTTPTAVFVGGSFIGLSYVDDASGDTALRPWIGFTPGLLGFLDASMSYVGSADASGFGSYTISAVPEPATLALWLGGVALLGAVQARRR
jgi:hypothetical protein